MLNDNAFVPFSYGPMNCVGKGLALLELRAIVCALVRRFRFEGWVGGKGDAAVRTYEKEYKDYFVTERGAVDVALAVRDI